MSSVTPTELEQLRDPSRDPVVTDGDKYKVIFENDRVRVLEYRDSPASERRPIVIPTTCFVRSACSSASWF